MLKPLLLTAAILATTIAANAQKKVANYSVSTYGNAAYEHYSFWSDKTIQYRYGSDAKEMNITYLGRKGNGFTVQFPNKQTYSVVLQGNSIVVDGISTKYHKVFNWEYEGPVDGRGTFCDVCTQDDKEAAALVKRVYLK